jgi:hypothetical protein
MTYPRHRHPTDDPDAAIRVRHLRFSDSDSDSGERAVPAHQLWGTNFGVVT